MLIASAEADMTEALSGLGPDDWIRAGIIIVVAFLLSQVVQRLAIRFVRGDEATAVAARFVGRGLGILVVLAGLVYALSSLEVRLGPLLGALGIGGLALAFAAQSILENFFSSILLQARHPFRAGDQVVVGDGIEGVVEDLNFRVVIIRTFDGERVFVPASTVLQNPIVNVTVRGPWRTSLSVGVAYGTDLRQAQGVLLEAAAEVDGVLDVPAPEAWLEAFGESSIDFSVRFWHDPRMTERWRVRSEVGMAIAGALDAAGITIPFPQRTLWFATPDDGSDRVQETA